MTPPTFSSDHAAAVWRRAAQMQADAARRLDEGSRALAPQAPAQADGYTLDEIRAAAGEAGIAPEFVALAMAEVRTQSGEGLTPRQDRAATVFMGTAERTLEVSRLMESPPARVYAALQRVLPVHPWLLSLRDSTGDPLAGGVLLFDIPGFIESNQAPLSMFAMSLEVGQVQVALRPGPGERGCEVAVRVPLHRSVRRAMTSSGWFAGVVGGAGGAGGAMVAFAVGVAGGLLALPAIGAAGVMAGATALGCRASYRNSIRGMRQELERLLQSVDAHARTGTGFAIAATSANGQPHEPARSIVPHGDG